MTMLAEKQSSLEELFPEPPKKSKDSFGEVVQFVDGHGYGIDAELNTVYLGTESEVRAAIGGQGRLDNPAAQATIELERKLKEGEQNDAGNFKPKRSGAFRNRITREVKRRTGYTRQIAQGKKLPICKVKR